MAVQAWHDFPPVGGSLFLDDYAACAPTTAGVPDTTALSDLTGGNNYGFLPRKRARVAAEPEGFFQDQRVPPAQGLVPLPATAADVMQSRAVCSGAASTSGRMVYGASLPFYHEDDEIDTLIRLESERMRAGLEEARRRHAVALLSAVVRATSTRVRAADAELERAVRRNAELEEKAQQMGAECQAWMGVARSHEAVAAGLRATLDQLLQSSAGGCEEGEAEDARSCCGFEAGDGDDDDAAMSRSRTAACRSCGGGEACVLLLPCRHLCLCRACEAAVDVCPVCAAAKNASLLVLVS